MKPSSEIIAVWKRVFSKTKYISILLISAFVFYLINGLILNLTNIKTFYSILGPLQGTKTLFIVSLKFISAIKLNSVLSIIILSVLFGMLASLLAYRFDINSKQGKFGVFTSIGIFLGAAAPGCAACGIGLLSILGLSSVLLSLPFQGLEISILAVVLLSFSVVNISRKLYNPVCKLNFVNSHRNERRLLKIDRRNKN